MGLKECVDTVHAYMYVHTFTFTPECTAQSVHGAQLCTTIKLQRNLTVTNHREHTTLFTISEIHYNQLKFHTRTSAGSHTYVRIRMFTINRNLL